MVPARDFAWRFGVVSALLVLTGVLVTAALSRWLVRPISELASAARDIAMGAHDRRVGIERGDEIGQLADAFNTMAGEVERTIADARHSQHEAIQANREKSAFLATMSHEIRTPINAIIGYIELLDMGVGGTLNAAQKQHIERVREASRHLTGLVEDVLDLSKVEAGELRVQAVTCVSDTLARAAVSVVAPQARLRGVELSVDCATVAFQGDPQRVRQILVNLLSNAVKFTDPGGSVRLCCRYEESEADEAGACLFEVSDTGCGIPLDQQAAIFDPFVQLDSGYTRVRGGAGLGLSISAQLARLMHGSIAVTSVLGEGSTFTLRMPAPLPVQAAVPAGG
jgi:signal transduction histidine kinase